MTDKELLELAARAAGYEIQWERVFCYRDHVAYYNVSFGDYWNSLYLPGDALRLAVALHLNVKQFPITDDGFSTPIGMVEVWRVHDEDPLHVEYLRTGDDRLSATCRAITRAAAEIGKGVKP